MPRDHARIHVNIWRDGDFRKLDRNAQHLYFTILSQPTLSYCGVMDWWPNRLAALASDGSETAVYDAAAALIEGRFIYVDSDTSELMVRTYIKHDGVMQRVNMGKAVARAALKVSSLRLVELIHDEMAALWADQPNLAGWEGFAEISPEDWQTVMGRVA